VKNLLWISLVGCFLNSFASAGTSGEMCGRWEAGPGVRHVDPGWPPPMAYKAIRLREFKRFVYRVSSNQTQPRDRITTVLVNLHDSVKNLGDSCYCLQVSRPTQQEVVSYGMRDEATLTGAPTPCPPEKDPENRNGPAPYGSAKLSDYARNGLNYNPLLLSYNNALEYCSAVGGHIPTVAELQTILGAGSNSFVADPYDMEDQSRRTLYVYGTSELKVENFAFSPAIWTAKEEDQNRASHMQLDMRSGKFQSLQQTGVPRVFVRCVPDAKPAQR